MATPQILSMSLSPESHPTPRGNSRNVYTTSTTHDGTNIVININNNDGSTGKGILIGMLSAFGSAIIVALLFTLIYFLRNTTRGRILLGRMGRPGQYDDEQAMLREEAEALESMDDLQRAEYLRAKGV